MKKDKEVQYVIDANILIYLEEYSSPKYHRRFWPNLEKALKRGSLVLIEPIAQECNQGELSKWIQPLFKKGLVVQLDQAVLDEADKLNKKYNITKRGSQGQTRSKGDPFLVAYAKLNGKRILTKESDKIKPSTKNVKSKQHSVTDVCKMLNIPYTRDFVGVLDQIDFKQCS